MNALTIRAALLCLGGLALASEARAADLALPKDGWVSWQIEGVEDAPAWCCWTGWDKKNPRWEACKLDGGSDSFGTRDNETTATVKVYARLAGGKVERLRVLAPTCPVETATPIRDLGDVATDDSARWLIALSKISPATGSKPDLHEIVLTALAIHRGNIAHEALNAIARGDSQLETRKKAVFWLAQLRGIPGAEIVTDLMFNDTDPDMREHATFAVSQSKSPTAARDLIRLGNTDKNGDVRGHAWFWLAQSEAPEAEAAIGAALKKDEDEDVREKAIAALAQLPDERATRALIAAAEDRSLSKEQRKRAVFWLAQSESEGAAKYLEKVLAGNTR